MTQQNEPQEIDVIIPDLDLLHSLSDIYYNLKGRKNSTDAHKVTLDNLENQIAVLTNKVLENIQNG